MAHSTGLDPVSDPGLGLDSPCFLPLPLLKVAHLEAQLGRQDETQLEQRERQGDELRQCRAALAASVSAAAVAGLGGSGVPGREARLKVGRAVTWLPWVVT